MSDTVRIKLTTENKEFLRGMMEATKGVSSLSKSFKDAIDGPKAFSAALKEASRSATASFTDMKKAESAIAQDHKKFASQWSENFKKMGQEAKENARVTKEALGTNSKAFSQFAQEIGKVRVALGLVKYAVAISGIAGIAGGIYALGKRAIETSSEFEGYNARLLTVVKSQEKANTVLAALNKYAEKTPFNIDEVTDSWIRLANYGLSPSTAKLTAIGNLAASNPLRNFADATEAVADAVVGQFTRMQESFGIRKEQVAAEGKNLIDSKGQITDHVKWEEAVFKYLADHNVGAMTNMTNTIQGKLSNLQDTLTRMFKKLGDNLAGSWKDALDAITNAISQFTDSQAFQDFTNSLKTVFTKDNIEKFAVSVLTIAIHVQDIINSLAGPLKVIEAVGNKLQGDSRPISQGDLSHFQPGKYHGFKFGPGFIPPASPFGGISDQSASARAEAIAKGIFHPIPAAIQPGIGQLRYYESHGTMPKAPEPADPLALQQQQQMRQQSAALMKEIQKQKDETRKAAIEAINDPELREIEKARFDANIAMREKDAQTRKNILIAEGREEAEITKKYYDERLDKEQSFSDHQEELNKKLADFQKQITEDNKKSDEDTYKRKEALLDQAERMAKGELAQIAVLKYRIQIENNEANRVQKADPTRAADLRAEAAQNQQKIESITFDLQKKSLEDRKKSTEVLVKMHEAILEATRKEGEEIKRFGEDIAESAKRLAKLNQDLVTATLPEQQQRSRQVLIDSLDTLAQGADPELVNEAAVAGMRRNLGLEPPDYSEVAGKWKSFWSDVAENSKRDFKSIGESFFEALLSGRANFKNAFKSLLLDLRQLVARALSNLAVEGIQSGLKNLFSGVFSGGGGGGKPKEAGASEQQASLVQSATQKLGGAFSGLIGVLAFGKNKLAMALSVLAQVLSSLRGGGGSGHGGGIFGAIIGAVTGFFTGGPAGAVLGAVGGYTGVGLPGIGGGGSAGGVTTGGIGGASAGGALGALSLGFKGPSMSLGFPSRRTFAGASGGAGGNGFTVHQTFHQVIGTVNRQVDLDQANDQMTRNAWKQTRLLSGA
jgi:hypothetical protein